MTVANTFIQHQTDADDLFHGNVSVKIGNGNALLFTDSHKDRGGAEIINVVIDRFNTDGSHVGQIKRRVERADLIDKVVEPTAIVTEDDKVDKGAHDPRGATV